MVDQSIPVIRRITQTKVTDGLAVTSALDQILIGAFSLIAHQAVMEKTSGLAVDLQHLLFKQSSGIGLTIFRHFQSALICQKFYRFHIFQILDAADKGDDISSCAAAKAVKGLRLRIDEERS